MRLASCSIAAALLAAVVVSGAPAASHPRISKPDRAAIGILIDRFVKDAVRRENLAAAWELAGPNLRGGTTRAAWVKGTGVTVPFYPAAGDDFRDAWTGHLVSPGRAQLALVLHPSPGSQGYDETVATIVARKIGGRWVVDLFYSAAVFHKNGGVSGPSDFGPGSAAPAPEQRVGGHWLLIGLASVGGLLVLIALAVVVRIRRRDRRAWAAYIGTGSGHKT